MAHAPNDPPDNDPPRDDPAFVDMRVDFAVEDLAEESFRWLYRYWLDGRGSARFPPTRLIDPTRIRPDILPHLTLVGPEPESGRLKVRLSGSGLREATDRDYTGWYTDEVPGAKPLHRRFEWCRRTGRPYVYSGHVTWSPLTFKRYSVLALPFGQPDGTVERILLLASIA